MAGRGGSQYDAINFVNFNQDASCISVGTRNGYKIYNCDPFGKCFSKSEGGISIVEMLFCTSLVALVGMGDQAALSPRRLHIVNTKRQTSICELTFPTAVLAVKLNRKRLIVVLEEQIYIYDITTMRLLHTIETSPNPNAIVSLSCSPENCFIAYPSPTPPATSPFSAPTHAPSSGSTVPINKSGDVVIFDTIALQPINVIEAHKSPLSVVCLNSEGTLLATASEKGTVIRVFSVPEAAKLYQFRRGTYPAQIYSMAFNASANFLCVSSATETIHIFRLASPEDRLQKILSASNGDDIPEEDDMLEYPENEREYARRYNPSVGSMIRRSSRVIGKHVAGAMGGYLPSSMTEMWEPLRDFASVKIPGAAGMRSVVALSNISDHLLLVTAEGYFYQFQVDFERGGECTLIKQYSLLDSSENVRPVGI